MTGGRQIIKVILGAALILLCAATLARAEDRLIQAEGSFGLEYNDNVIYNPFVSSEGSDLIEHADILLSLNPKLADWMTLRLAGAFYQESYRVKPDYNTDGLSGDISLMINPFGPNFFYLLLGSASFNIGEKSLYSSRAATLQYIFDWIGGGGRWTTIWAEGREESYTNDFGPLSNTSSCFGIKQSLSDWFYLTDSLTNSRAREEDLSYLENSGGVGFEFGSRCGNGFVMEAVYSRKNFLAASTFASEARMDLQGRTVAAITKEINSFLFLKLEYGFTHNECNLKLAETRQGYASYDQNSLALSLTLRY